MGGKVRLASNVQKCQVLHVGHSNKLLVVTMNGIVLLSSKEEKERDLVVVVMSATLKLRAQSAKAAMHRPVQTG